MFSGISSYLWGEEVKGAEVQGAEVKGAEAEAKPTEVKNAKEGTDQGGMGEVMNVDDLDVMSLGSDDDISLSPTRRMSDDEWEMVKLGKLKGKLHGSKAHEKRRSRRAKEVLKTPTMKDLFKPSPTVVAVPSFEKSWASIVKDSNTPPAEVESSEPFLLDNSSPVTTSECNYDSSESFNSFLDERYTNNLSAEDDIYDYEEEYLARTLKETLISKQYNSNVPRLKSYSMRARRPATAKVEKHTELSYAVKTSPPPCLASEKHPSFYRNRVESGCENTNTLPEENLFNMGKREARFMNYMNRKVKLDDRKRKKQKLMEDKYSRKTKPNTISPVLSISDIETLMSESKELHEKLGITTAKPTQKAVKQEVKKCLPKPKPSVAENDRVSSRQRTTSLHDQQVENYYWLKMLNPAKPMTSDAENERVIPKQPTFEAQHQLDSETLPHKVAGSRLNFYRRSPRLKKSLSVSEWINDESNELRVFLDIKMNPKKCEGKGVDSFFNRLTHIAMPSAAESAEEVADQLNRKAEEHYKPERRHKRDKERLALSRKHIAMSNASRSLNMRRASRGGLKAPRARATQVREKRSGRASANKRQ